MLEKLIAYYAGEPVGVLQREGDSYVFQYTHDWLTGDLAIPLSLSLPLQEAPFTAAQTQPFFSNLLPEGQFRDHIAGKYRISADDDFALLAVLAGDCAGAISLCPEGSSAPDHGQYQYRRLSDDDQRQMFDEAFIMDLTFLSPREQTRLSLAGVQDKLPVAIFADQLFLPLNGAPSSHILKPQHPRWKHLVENETFCMALAGAMGLNVPDSYMLDGAERAYVVKRYDRRSGDNGEIYRIHQEDFCQALGLSYRRKYQEQGGPGFKDCFALLQRCQNPLVERIRLIELAIFNLLIGNNDCHAKNISLLYAAGRNPSLAPFYDLVCVAAYNLPAEMAMCIGGVFHPRDLQLEAWQQFARDIGMASLKPLLSTLKQMATKIPVVAHDVADKMIHTYGDSPIYREIHGQIEHRAAVVLRQIA